MHLCHGVNHSVDQATGIEKTVTTNKKKCCNAPGEGSNMEGHEGAGELVLSSSLKLDRRTLEDLDLLKRVLG